MRPTRSSHALTLAIFVLLQACHSGDSSRENGNDTAAANVEAKAIVPEDRVTVKTEPVDQIREKTDNPLNDWYFTVKLFETSKTFEYRLNMQFEELKGDDTIRIPDIGIMPKPVLKKGPEKYSCIVGFMDDKNVFREYKLVHVEHGDLKVTSLKHYSVTAK